MKRGKGIDIGPFFYINVSDEQYKRMQWMEKYFFKNSFCNIGGYIQQSSKIVCLIVVTFCNNCVPQDRVKIVTERSFLSLFLHYVSSSGQRQDLIILSLCPNDLSSQRNQIKVQERDS